MGFGDKLKGLRDQAQQAVVENKDKIQGAVQSAAEVANVKTGGKYADKISGVGQKLSANLDKLGEEPASTGAAAGAEPAATGAFADEEPAAAVAQEAPTVAPTGAPPEFE